MRSLYYPNLLLLEYNILTIAFLGGILGIKHAGNLTTSASYSAKKCENLL